MLRYAFGMPASQKERDLERLPRATLATAMDNSEESEFLAIVFFRRASDPDLEFRVEISADLTNWIDVTDQSDFSSELLPPRSDTDVQVERVVARSPVAVSSTEKYFIRVRVVQ